MNTRSKQYTLFAILTVLFGTWYLYSRSNLDTEEIPLSKVENRSFEVTVKTVGELEAAKSTIIASSIRGDLGKILSIVPDGVNVKPGDVLVTMDPTPFEEKIEKLDGRIKEQEAF